MLVAETLQNKHSPRETMIYECEQAASLLPERDHTILVVSGSPLPRACHTVSRSRAGTVLMGPPRIGSSHEQVFLWEVEICEGDKTSCESTTVAVSSTETLNACEDSVRPTACRQESMKQEISIICDPITND